TARTRLANDATLLPALGRQLAAAQDGLAVLQGAFPAAWTPPAIDLDDLRLPARLPLAVPSALVRARPDIRAAESLLHARSAAVGVATARQYPNIVLSASLATAGLSPASLFGSTSAVWTIAGGIAAPVFHGGALAARRREADAQFSQALALYRQTVLAAFGQVADTLRALGQDAALVEDERGALGAAAAGLELQRASYAAGRGDVLRLLDAEREFQQARLGYARARAQRYVDSAQLFVAMGGAQ
ncbi:MAG: TolC family protein, partial [Gammaproteobacteria bacterium]|nr:TolC family protein [Gammaproteobacteria bacterium]